MMLLATSTYWPFVVLLLGMVTVIVLISAVRLHAFVALMLSAIFVGLISTDIPNPSDLNAWVAAVELPMVEFGSMAGKIAWVIALAAIIGIAMLESGAADSIVKWLLKVFGEQRAGVALLLSGFILSIPVFFDTVFFLLIPIGRALGIRTGKNYMFYVMAIGGGAAITHSIVPPTPGPLLMAESFNIDLGITIIMGLLMGILPAILVLFVAKKINERSPVEVRDTEEATNKSESTFQKLPSLGVSFMPIVLPILLISLASLMNALGEGSFGGATNLVAFLGNKNIAMLLGTIVALWLWAKQKGMKFQELGGALGHPLEIAGVIILITSAGGAFGAMIKHSGIGNAVEAATAGMNVSYILLAWLIAAVMKIAQGSSTVALITTASIMSALIGDGASLGYHPIYILMATGFGGLFISWMNDSGFWVVAKMSGFSEKETLSSWTILLAAIALVGLIQVLILSVVFPMV